MSNSQSTGPSRKSGSKASLFADRRFLALIVMIVGVAGYYAFVSWSENQERAMVRSKLLSATYFGEDGPSSDELSRLMAGITKLPDASTATDLLAAQARIELQRGRPERAEKLFGAVASNPAASADERSLGARIVLALHEGFGGDLVEAKTMLERVLQMSESAYAETDDVADLFRAWQAAKRVWDPRAMELAVQLKAEHGESRESGLAQLSTSFEPVRDSDAVEQLVAEFKARPAELRAMQAIVMVHKGDLPGALREAEQDLLVSSGTPCVRIALAYVLHACASGHAAGSADRDVFVGRRDEQLDWLDKRAPVETRAKWAPMRQLR